MKSVFKFVVLLRRYIDGPESCLYGIPVLCDKMHRPIFLVQKQAKNSSSLEQLENYEHTAYASRYKSTENFIFLKVCLYLCKTLP